MKKPLWVTRDDCVAIHELMLAQHGGLAGMRDEGLLESALARPRNLFSYGKPTLNDLAASYGAGIIGNHPFLDGNKRTGFMAAAVFLEVNGYELIASEESVVRSTVALAASEWTEAQYARWLKTNLRRRR